MIWLSYAAHVLSAIAQLQVSLSLYRGGDTLGYYRRAVVYMNLFLNSPSTWGPRIVAHTFQVDIGWPLSIFAGTSAGSLTGLTVLPALLTGGSAYGTFLLFGLTSFLAKVLCVRAARSSLPESSRIPVMCAFLLVPSTVFWTCGIVKESVALSGLGIAVFGWSRVVNKYRVIRGVLLTLTGMLLVALIKPYILFPFVVASGVWYYWHHSEGSRIRLRPVHFVVGAVLAIGGVTALGELFPQYGVERVAEEAARLQRLGAETRGGSSYDIVDTEVRTIPGQLAFAPIALATTLFRPLPIEVNNAASAVNAFEVFVITLLLLRVLMARGLRGFARLIVGNPFLMFAMTFTVIAGIAIGLATTNLGTLSRYRVPMFSFYVVLIAVGYPRRRRPRVPQPRARSRST